MFPEGFEPLSFEDHVIVARINLCCVAIVLIVFAFLDAWEWPSQTATLVGAAGLIYLARQIEWVFRWLDRSPEPEPEPEPQPQSQPPDTFPSTF
jgi:hypothetical protein